MMLLFRSCVQLSVEPLIAHAVCNLEREFENRSCSERSRFCHAHTTQQRKVKFLQTCSIHSSAFNGTLVL